MKVGTGLGLMLLVAALAGLPAGCASSGPATTGVADASASADTAAAGGQRPTHAKCLVCEKNADLACVDLDVDASTPCCAYNGTTYYFCSNKCRTDFQKKPQRYVSR